MKKVQIYPYVTPAVRSALFKIAKKEGVTITYLIWEMLSDWFNSNKTRRNILNIEIQKTDLRKREL